MNRTSQRVAYSSVNAFSNIVLDYLANAEALKPFYTHGSDVEGVKKAIEQRTSFNTNRAVLVSCLQEQYNSIGFSEAVSKNIALLLEPNTFTITTAHQPNLFTGPLYFIYKILHAIKLANTLNSELPQYNFVPVYFMGSEDADFEELSFTNVNNVKHQWHTQQNGAFGRMLVDESLVQLITNISGQLLVEKYGNEIISALQESYKVATTIQDSTLKFVHFLFERFGLVVLNADTKAFKQQMIPVFKDELLNNTSAKHIANTIEVLGENYKVQAGGRAINLFYFDEDLRERIEGNGEGFAIANSTIRFTKEEMLNELNEHPERFSPNVILRALYQETILPNVTFVGGGGELAYWLELKSIFVHYAVPFPVIVLRNSFLVCNNETANKFEQLGFSLHDCFKSTHTLLTEYVQRSTKNNLLLNNSLININALYDVMKDQATSVDPSLLRHVEALKTQAVNKINGLQKKIIRAEKRKYANEQRQIQTIKQQLFPNDSLQERNESILGLYAKEGKGILDVLYQQSLSFEQEFVIIAV